MKTLDIKRVILRKIGVRVKCHRPKCGEVVVRGEAVFIHNRNKFCCRFCAEAYYQGVRLKEIRE
jgi:hypothetical protein